MLEELVVSYKLCVVYPEYLSWRWTYVLQRFLFGSVQFIDVGTDVLPLTVRAVESWVEMNRRVTADNGTGK